MTDGSSAVVRGADGSRSLAAAGPYSGCHGPGCCLSTFEPEASCSTAPPIDAGVVILFPILIPVLLLIQKPHVRWKKILYHDPLSCARLLYCGLGGAGAAGDLQQGLAYMLTLDPKEEDTTSLEAYREAYDYGRLGSNSCRLRYPTCPFPYSTMLTLLEHMISSSRKA
ncbi:hypothetical protein EVAR_62771_1 [Eumeta japonica]|uniref:Uncharacterized protein n=1 Tax=Eumeta variegata TaxID=151549 RepID=A0A4C1ZHH4_EUMVA|nr:hypothetical protein EVAR_62771_1 [Eumeta japonica]